MNILLGGDCDNGGGSYWLAQAINKYTDHEARAVRGYQSYLKYPYDVLGINREEMKMLVRWADVIHIRDRLPKVDLHNKAVAITFTGRLFRKCTKSVTRAASSGWAVCVVTPDMMAFCPESHPTWLPNPREPIPQYVARTHKFSVCQAPTSRSAKQTEKVIRACQRANVRLDVVEKIAYDECLKRKGRAWVTVDQFKYGYGNNAIEGWAMGQPVISGFAKQGPYRRAHLDQYGELPFAEARPNARSIQAVIERLRDDREYFDEMVERGQDHFWCYHHAPVVAQRAVRIYQRLLNSR